MMIIKKMSIFPQYKAEALLGNAIQNSFRPFRQFEMFKYMHDLILQMYITYNELQSVVNHGGLTRSYEERNHWCVCRH